MLIITAVIPEWSEVGGSPRVLMSDSAHNVGATWNWTEKRWSTGEPHEAYETAAYRPRMNRSGSPAHQSVFYLREAELPGINVPSDSWRGTIYPASGAPPVPQPDTNLRLLHPITLVQSPTLRPIIT